VYYRPITTAAAAAANDDDDNDEPLLDLSQSSDGSLESI